MSNTCPICDSSLNFQPTNVDGSLATAYGCPKCGLYTLSRQLIITLPRLLSQDADARAKLSQALRRANEREDQPFLTIEMAEAIIRHPLPRPREQADLLIRWLAQNVPGPGETVRVDFKTHGSLIGSKSPAGFALVLDHLFESGLVTGRSIKLDQANDIADATLSFKGWEYYEQLREGAAVYRKAFMAMKFGDEKLNSILETVFKPSVRRAGFDLFKLDDVPKAGLIDNRLRVEIQSSDFLIADLSHDNLGAYWEAGYAEGLGKPVIYTCETSKFESARTHFDTNHHLTIVWDAGSPDAAGENLTATIRATLPHLARLTDQET